MNAGLFQVLHDGANEDLLAVRGRIDVNFRCVAKVLVHQQRLIRCEVGLTQIAIELLLIGQDFHATATQDIGGPDKHGEADFFHCRTQVIGRGAGSTSWHAQAVSAGKGFEALTVAGFVNGVA